MKRMKLPISKGHNNKLLVISCGFSNPLKKQDMTWPFLTSIASNGFKILKVISCEIYISLFSGLADSQLLFLIVA